ncbi:MAG TPA: ABC transporter permease subunit [Chloroflexota bacterium]|nr:ABC transporter permease subunit [Chloroflexota bacterium]
MMFWNMLRIEQQKLWKRTILRVELIIMGVGVLALNALFFAISRMDGSNPAMAQLEQTLVWPLGLVQSVGLAAGPSLGGILMVILVGAVVAQEYTWRTLQLWLSRGVPRSTFLAAKFAALLLPALLLVLTPLFFGGLVTAVLSQIILGHIPVDAVEWGRLLTTTLATAYSLLPYAGLAFFLAVATRSVIVAVGAGLAYILLLEGIVVQLLTFAGGGWADIGRYLPAGLGQGMLSIGTATTVEVGGQAAPAIQFLEPGAAAIGIALYSVAFVALSIVIFRRQDLGG